MTKKENLIQQLIQGFHQLKYLKYIGKRLINKLKRFFKDNIANLNLGVVFDKATNLFFANNLNNIDTS